MHRRGIGVHRHGLLRLGNGFIVPVDKRVGVAQPGVGLRQRVIHGQGLLQPFDPLHQGILGGLARPDQEFLTWIAPVNM